MKRKDCKLPEDAQKGSEWRKDNLCSWILVSCRSLRWTPTKSGQKSSKEGCVSCACVRVDFMWKCGAEDKLHLTQFRCTDWCIGADGLLPCMTSCKLHSFLRCRWCHNTLWMSRNVSPVVENVGLQADVSTRRNCGTRMARLNACNKISANETQIKGFSWWLLRVDWPECICLEVVFFC